MTKTKTAATQSKFGSARFKRRVDVDKARSTPGVTAFKSKSFSRDDDTRYALFVDEKTGEFHCDCPDHHFRHRACKHILRALATLERHHKNEKVRPCVSCGSENAQHDLADENGHALPGHICGDCVTRARMMDGTPEPPEYSGYDEAFDDGLEAGDCCSDCGRILEEMPRAIAPYDYEIFWGCARCESAREAVMYE